MRIIRAGEHIQHIPGYGISVRESGVAVAESNWWEVAGKTCVAAYQPKGAASLAASYGNLANPGTYTLGPGDAPTFDTALGWTFDGIADWLTQATGYVLNNDARTCVGLIRLLAAPATYANVGLPAWGGQGTNERWELLITNSRRLYLWLVGGDISTTLTLTLNQWHGIAIRHSGTRCDIFLDAASTGANRTLNTKAGAVRIARDASNRYGNLDEAACAVYSDSLTNDEIAALFVAMAAL